MNAMNVGDGKVVLLAGGGKIFTDIAAKFVKSERSLEEIIASPYDKKIVHNIINSGHKAVVEFDYFIFGVEGYSRVTEMQLVRKRIASYIIKTGRAEKGGKRSFDVVLPESIKNLCAWVMMPGQGLVKIDTMKILEIIEKWYAQGVANHLPEEDLRYLKPQATEFKGLIGMNCYSEDTEVLTNCGWKFFKDLNGDELFYSINPDTQVVELIPATSRIVKEHNGKMISVNSQSISLLTTPEHNNLVSYDWEKENRKFVLDKAINMDGHKNISMMKSCDYVVASDLRDNFIIEEVNNKQFHPNGEIYKEISVPMEEALQLIGFYLADGSLFHHGKHDTTKCGITLSKGNKNTLLKYKAIIDSWLDTDCKIYYNNHGCYNLVVYSPQLYSLFKPQGTAVHKYIPEFIWELPKGKLQYLYKGLLDGDCNNRNGHITFCTSSKKLADDIQRLLLHLGFSGTIGINDKKTISEGFDCEGSPYSIKSINTGYVISVNCCKNTPFIVQYNDTGKTITEEEYSGLVYCVELEKNHTLYVRRKGRCVWSGNCHALLDWFAIRCCKNAQAEIRDMANKMLALCKEAAPDLFAQAGPNCRVLGYCPENGFQHKECRGKVLTKQKALEILERARLCGQ